MVFLDRELRARRVVEAVRPWRFGSDGARARCSSYLPAWPYARRYVPGSSSS